MREAVDFPSEFDIAALGRMAQNTRRSIQRPTRAGTRIKMPVDLRRHTFRRTLARKRVIRRPPRKAKNPTTKRVLSPRSKRRLTVLAEPLPQLLARNARLHIATHLPKPMLRSKTRPPGLKIERRRRLKRSHSARLDLFAHSRAIPHLKPHPIRKFTRPEQANFFKIIPPTAHIYLHTGQRARLCSHANQQRNKTPG